MIGSKSQSSQRPTAFGTLLQASAYGMAIPNIYGMTKSNLLAIWAANLRKGSGSGKKFKGGKKGQPVYVEGIDFLVGKNPILGVNQLLINGGLIPLQLKSTTFAVGTAADFTIADAHFYSIIGITMTGQYSVTFDDYGAAGTAAESGTFEIPLWNQLVGGPDPGDPGVYRCWPFHYRWCHDFGATFYIDNVPLKNFSNSGNYPAAQLHECVTGAITVWYYALMSATSYQSPLQHNRLAFENELGSGSEYADNGASLKQIVYPMYAGVGSSDIDLGSSGTLPSIEAEVQGKFGRYATGDCDFVDIIEDIVKSGIAQAGVGTSSTGQAYTQLEHGLSARLFPGCVQKKIIGAQQAATATIAYDLPNTAGNALFLLIIADAASPATVTDSLGNTWTQQGTGSWTYDSTTFTWTLLSSVGCLAGANTLTLTNYGTGVQRMVLTEVSGVDTLDGVDVVTADSPSVSLTPTNTQSFAATLLAFSHSLNPAPSPTPLWKEIVAPFRLIHSNLGPGGAVPPVAVPAGQAVAWTTPAAAAQYVTPPPPGHGVAGSVTGLSTETAILQAWGGNGSGFTVAAEWSNFPVPTLPPGAVISAIYPVFMVSGQNSGIDGLFAAITTPPAISDGFGWAGGSTTRSTTPSLPGGNFATEEFYVPSFSADPATLADLVMHAQIWFAAGSAFDPAILIDVSMVAVAVYYSVSDVNPGEIFVQQRNVRNPGTYTLGWRTSDPNPGSFMAAVALKATTPGAYPMPLPDFLDRDSLDIVRQQCQANGLWGSLTTNSQQTAQAWLEQLYAAANAAPCFIGFRLYSVPYSEVSAVGNGAVYTAPTAAGPVADLSVDNGDILEQGKGTPPVLIKTKARVNLPNVLQMQCISRTSNYAQTVVSQPEAASIALYGVRKSDPVVNNAVQDASIARKLLGVMVRRNQYGQDLYTFSINARWDFLSLMDLITVTDRLAGIVKQPVRIASIQERDGGGFDCEAEPFVYGMCAPSPLPVTVQTPTDSGAGADPGLPNAPVIFEAVPRLYGSTNTPKLFIAVSGASANFGGSQVYISTDGGNSYDPVGETIGNAVTGVTTADWPAAASPDTTNDLALDLTESNGVLESYAVTDEDNFKFPCYVAGGGANPINYELMAYAVAQLTATSKYTLKATGTGNHLNRGVFAAPLAGQGVDHPSGSRFLFVDPAGTGILQVPLQPQWVGVTLHIKCVPFNSFGNSGQQTLESATDYTYTPTGAAGSSNLASSGFLVNGN